MLASSKRFMGPRKALSLRVALVATLAVALSLGACSRSGNDSTSTVASGSGAGFDTPSLTPTQDLSKQDPCGLLTTAEIEAVLGPLAGPPYRVGNNGPDATGSACVYEERKGHQLRLNVTWEDGASLMAMLGKPAAAAADANMTGKLPLPDGFVAEGEWDEARIMGCCDISALRGDQLLQLDYGATALTDPQAIALLNAAFKRIGNPIAADGAGGVDAALAREAERQKSRPTCSLLTRAEIEAIIGPLLSAPEGDGTKCTFRYTLQGQDGKPRPWAMDVSVAWSGGYRIIREEPIMAASVMKGLLGDQAKDPGDIKPVSIPGPWEQAAVTMDFLAVKHDRLVRIDLRLTSRPVAEKVAAKLMEKL